MENKGLVKSAVERILIKRDFSLSAADSLVSAILEEFPDDQRFEEILDVLAQYRPGGGGLLFDEKRLESECREVLKLV